MMLFSAHHIIICNYETPVFSIFVNQQTCVKCLLCVRHCANFWGYKKRQKTVPDFNEITIKQNHSFLCSLISSLGIISYSFFFTPQCPFFAWNSSTIKSYANLILKVLVSYSHKYSPCSFPPIHVDGDTAMISCWFFHEHYNMK